MSEDKELKEEGGECNCPYCDEEAAEAPYCQPCGVRLRYCPRCDIAVEREATTCPRCGGELEWR